MNTAFDLSAYSGSTALQLGSFALGVTPTAPNPPAG